MKRGFLSAWEDIPWSTGGFVMIKPDANGVVPLLVGKLKSVPVSRNALLRIFTPVPRGTKAFKDIFKTRTCSERVNNRVLNDYKVEHMQTRVKSGIPFLP